jgi:hypothetical protein
MHTISNFLKRVALVILGATDLKTIADMFSVMEKFLSEEPDKGFKNAPFMDTKDVPLTLTDETLQAFKEKTSKFPDLYKTGLTYEGEEKDRKALPFNFLYSLGQLLSKTAISFEAHALVDKPTDVNFQRSARKFYWIWGSHREMNARNLVDKYAGQDTSRTKRAIMTRLTASTNLFEKEILPNL